MRLHQSCPHSPERLASASKGLLSLAVLLFTATFAAAQPPSLSQRVLESEDPAAFRAEIDAYQEHFLQQLFGEDASAVAESREQLTAPLKPEASAPFKGLYTDLLATRILRRAPAAPMYNQLNAAIVTERLARLTKEWRLAAVIRLFLEDDDASVALWGAKAATPIFPELITNLPQREREALVASLIGAAKRFPDSGPLAEDVFKALSMRTTEPRPPGSDVLQNGAATVVPAVHELMAFRVGQYRPAESAPSPLAEVPGLVILTNNFVWPRQSPEQKARTMAMLRDLMLQATASANAMPTSQEDRVQILELIKRIGSAYEAVTLPAQAGAPSEHPELNRAANKLKNISARSSPAALSQAVQEVQDGLAKAYPDLPPPQLSTRSAPGNASAGEGN